MSRDSGPAPDLGRVGHDLEVISTYRDPDLLGWTRRVFSPIDMAARAWVGEQMAAAGLTVETDAGGNLIGRLRGTEGRRAALVTGSHTDTVHGGGRFDGIIGVLGAIEVVRMLTESGRELRHDLVVVDFLGEEPNDFGLSCVGSRAIVGALGPEHLDLVDPGGRRLRDLLAEAGGDPENLAAACWPQGALRCFVELHIEQGPRLERAGASIGVVSGIVGIHRFLSTFTGRPDHAGTTPMGERRDALLGAAEAALRIEDLAAGGVATAGRLDVRPGAHNVVPAEADLWAEVRSDDTGWLGSFGRDVEVSVNEIGSRRSLATSLSWVSREDPVLATSWVRDTVARAAVECGFEPVVLPSGAGHDAAHMARLGPMGMIFVPSRDGRSHCPEEWTDLVQIGDGISVLAETLLACDTLDEAGTDGAADNGARPCLRVGSGSRQRGESGTVG